MEADIMTTMEVRHVQAVMEQEKKEFGLLYRKRVFIMGKYVKKFPKDIQIGDCISMVGRDVVDKVGHPFGEPPFFIITLDDDSTIYPIEDEEIYIYIKDSPNFT